MLYFTSREVNDRGEQRRRTLDFKGLEAADIVRLKFFLARQSEGMHVRHRQASAGKTLPEQQAAILACLAWMEDYAGGQMSGREICKLLQVLDTRLSTVMSQMETKGLVVEADNYYRITAAGVQRLSEFADRVLGIPSKVEAELDKKEAYRDLMVLCQQLIDDDLRSKFQAAKEPDRPRRSKV